MERAYINLGSIGGGGGLEEVVEEMQEVVIQALSTSICGLPATGTSRSVSPVKLVKRGLELDKSESVRVSECVDEVSAMRAVNDKLRKFLFTENNRVSKSVKEFTLKCCSELEEQMMRKITKNGTLL